MQEGFHALLVVLATANHSVAPAETAQTKQCLLAVLALGCPLDLESIVALYVDSSGCVLAQLPSLIAEVPSIVARSWTHRFMALNAFESPAGLEGILALGVHLATWVVSQLPGFI